MYLHSMCNTILHNMLNIFEQTLSHMMLHIEAEKSVGHIPQPLFLIGSFGSGKTTLLIELARRLRENGWGESVQLLDGKEFFSSNDIIKAIEGTDYDGTRPLKGNGDRRRIVIIDDLDFFFNRSPFDDQYLLRNYLYQPEAPMLIAAVPKISEALADYKAPFFEGVRTIYIPAITQDSLSETLNLPEEKAKRLSALLAYLPPVIRSVKIACDIIDRSDWPDNDLKELSTLSAPIYRARFDSLPAYSQKILISLSKSATPLNLSQLRELISAPAGSLSPYLQQLVQDNTIRKTDPEKRGTPYEITDKLFKLWLSNGLEQK